MKRNLVCLILFVAFFVDPVVAESIQERNALLEFYRSTNGPNWDDCNYIGWYWFTNTSTACNTSSTEYLRLGGVTCNANGQVAEIDLSRCGLGGTLPASLDALLSLTKLDLSESRIGGTLPASWRFRNLTRLVLSVNRLNGTLPEEWGALDPSSSSSSSPVPFWSAILDMELSSNRFIGTLPASWGQLTSMVNVFVEGNVLRGTLPPAWATLRRLWNLNIRDNQLSGTLPASWRTLRFGFLFARNNSFIGTLPSEWADNPYPMQMSLEMNNLRGPVPESWPKAFSNMGNGMTCGNITCTGSTPPSSRCSTIYTMGAACKVMTLVYNCFDTALSALPPANSTYKWNWRSVNFGPQRSNCPYYQLPTATWSETNPKPTRTTTIPMSMSDASRTLTKTRSSTKYEDSTTPEHTLTTTLTTSEEVIPPSRYAPRLPSAAPLATAAWSSVPAGILFGGPVVAFGVQRAVLQGQLAGCDEEAVNDRTLPLDIASSPTQLCFGPPEGQCIRGAVIGNLLLSVASVALTCVIMFVHAWRLLHKQRSRSVVSVSRILRTAQTSSAAFVGFPGVLHALNAFLLQPLAASSLQLLIAPPSPEHKAADLVIGVLGLLATLGYMAWASWICTCGRRAFFRTFSADRHTAPTTTSLNSSWLIVRGLHALIERGRRKAITRWFSSPHDSTFVKRYGAILESYRGGMQWYIVVEFVMVLVGALLGALVLSSTSCRALQAVFCTCSSLFLVLICVVQPYESWWDFIVSLMDLILSTAWSFVTVLADPTPVLVSDGISEAQLWIPIGILGLGVVLVVDTTLFASSRSSLRSFFPRRCVWLATYCFTCARQRRGGGEQQEHDEAAEQSDDSTEQFVPFPKRSVAVMKSMTTLSMLAEMAVNRRRECQHNPLRLRQLQEEMVVLLVNHVCDLQRST